MSSDTKTNDRVRFDNEDNLAEPQTSQHWQNLDHQSGDCLLQSWEELYQVVLKQQETKLDSSGNWKYDLATFSCLLGYLEALATHKQTDRRYRIFPIPWDALQRLIQIEWKQKVQDITHNLTPVCNNSGLIPPMKELERAHRLQIQGISNGIWSAAISKPNVKDELHANSVYVLLRGRIDNKGLDCFGAAVATIAMHHSWKHSVPKNAPAHYLTSRLTLSEDHAYERHYDSSDLLIGTCEVAVPGTTKAQQAKRGRDIGATFVEQKRTTTPETSWLYMASNPVVCQTLGMTLVALVGNLNTIIDPPPKSGGRPSLASAQLYDLKRNLLWWLYDLGYMKRFPFGLLELGDCEEHRGSPRGEEWVTVDGIPEPVLVNEQLFLEAIQINKEIYNGAQVYPYFYIGYYHKDAGNQGREHEYRFVHSMKYFAKAAQTASAYVYDGIDSLALNKHMSTLAGYISNEILRQKDASLSKTEDTANDNKKSSLIPRQWNRKENELAIGTWLIGFFDSLLLWEELSPKGRSFVEILTSSHANGIAKLFGVFSHVSRLAILEIVQPTNPTSDYLPIDDNLPIFREIRSQRLRQDGLLWKALAKPKVKLSEMELTIPSSDADQEDGRRSKRRRRG